MQPVPEVKRGSGRERGWEPIVAVLLDTGLVLGALELATRMRFGLLVPEVDARQLQALLPLLLLTRLGALYAAGLYRRSFRFPRGFDYADLVQAWAAGTVLLAAGVFFGRLLEASRLVLVGEAVLSGVGLMAWRGGLAQLSRFWTAPRPAYYIGDPADAQRLNQFLAVEEWEYRIVGTVDRDLRLLLTTGPAKPGQSPGGERELLPHACVPPRTSPIAFDFNGNYRTHLSRNDLGLKKSEERRGENEEGKTTAPDVLFVDAAHFDDGVRARAAGRRIYVVAGVRELWLSGAAAYNLGGCVVLDTSGVRHERHYLLAKRGLDLAVGVAGLLILAPLFLVLAAAIRMASPGPVFFSQPRLGRDGRPFHILKFRTMQWKASGPSLTRVDDERVFPLGRFLRRWSLDELPQLYNVVAGHMALVGPRPEVPDLAAAWPDWRRVVLEAQPGLTGLAQVMGRDELHEDEKAELDVFYAVNRSFEMDVSIILRTFRAVIRYRGRA